MKKETPMMTREDAVHVLMYGFKTEAIRWKKTLKEQHQEYALPTPYFEKSATVEHRVSP